MTYPFEIRVQKCNGKETTLKLDKNLTIEELKKFIAQKFENENYSEYVIVYEGKPLENVKSEKTMTVEDYKLKSFSKIFVIGRVKGGK